MASKVEICNLALAKIGQPAIMSLDDNSPRARYCLQEYDSALEAALRSYPWPFAIVRKELGRKQKAPIFGFAYYYEIPADSVRIVDIFTGGQKYQIESEGLATNAEHVAIRYVSKKIPVEKLDPQTLEVVVLALAVRISIPITENMQLKDMLFSEMQVALAQARNTWSVEDYPQEVIEGNWLKAHDSGRVIDPFKDTWNPWGPNGNGVSG